MRELERILSGYPSLTIAVSGGADSMTLAHMAVRVLGNRAAMVHAISPAVPAAATARVRRHATRNGWRLRIIDAGEMRDPRYRANPVNRCYFCKQNLYAAVAALAEDRVASGANTDDLGDYRPGLGAAAEAGVVHPLIEAGLDKAAVYGLAQDLGLTDLASLPPQPCLSSRVETGIAIEQSDLAFIEGLESRLHASLGAAVVLRCRVTRSGIVVELGDMTGAGRAAAVAAPLCRKEARSFLGVRPYRQGSAFLHEVPA